MSSSNTNIAKVAQLARLNLSEAEVATMEKDISKILDFISILNQVDVENIEPTANVAGLTNVEREDILKNSQLQERLLAQAPAIIEDELIKVPAVLPGEGMA